MPDALSRNALPRSAVAAIGVVLFGTLLSVATVRLTGTEIHTPDAPTVLARSLRFEDRDDGSVAILDARSGRLLDSVHGEAGFLRGTLRALTRERKRRDIGSAPPFELMARADGRLTLADPATGQRIDLESFGAGNAAVYGRLLRAQP
jgi:putative photosynthetic complex assembly protein